MAASDSQSPKSLNNNTPTYVQFVNCTGRRIHLFWLDYGGKLVRYGQIPPRRGVSMNTFVTHPWIARDASTWYPLLLNEQPIFFPVAGRGDRVFNDFDRDRIDIHIPVYPLFRRCLEVVYLNFQRDAIAWTNIPKNIKDILLKMASPTSCTFKDYADFDHIVYERLHGIADVNDGFLNQNDDTDESDYGSDSDNNDDHVERDIDHENRDDDARDGDGIGD